MNGSSNSRERLLQENEHLRDRLEEAEAAVDAIRSGEVDALVISSPDGEQVFTLQGAEHPYRVMVETMNEGAATVLEDGTILYKPPSWMLKTPPNPGRFFSPGLHRSRSEVQLDGLVEQGFAGSTRARSTFSAAIFPACRSSFHSARPR
jgi:hypothetical protein